MSSLWLWGLFLPVHCFHIHGTFGIKISPRAHLICKYIQMRLSNHNATLQDKYFCQFGKHGWKCPSLTELLPHTKHRHEFFNKFSKYWRQTGWGAIFVTDLGESLLLAHFKNGLGRLFIFIHFTILKHIPTKKNIRKIFGFSIFKLWPLFCFTNVTISQLKFSS